VATVIQHKIMTQQEFTQRTKVEVSYNEFNAIHEVYVNSDLDKDEFCKAWMNINAKRVAQAKADAKAKAEEEAKFEMLWDIIMEYGSIGTCSNEMHTELAVAILSEKQQENLESLGFDMKEDWCIGNSNIRPYKRMSTILYEIDKYLKAA